MLDSVLCWGLHYSWLRLRVKPRGTVGRTLVGGRSVGRAVVVVEIMLAVSAVAIVPLQLG